MPNAAINMMTLNDAAFDPTAEFRKLTASLLTPTTKSEIARINKTPTSTM